MSYLHAHVPIILFIFLSLSLPQTIKSQVLLQECPGAKDPSYHDKIDLLLAELHSKSNHTSYFNYTVGVAPDVLYGLYMCRGDISMQRCHACLQDAVPSIKKICPDNVEATVWYADCTLRYANRTIFSNADSNVWGGKGQPSGQGTANQYAKDFGGQLSNLMRPLMEDAARSSPKHFAINKSDISTFATLYGLVQCLPDTRYGDCQGCLVEGYKHFAECCNDSFWGQMFLRGCNLMFSIDPIFDESALPPTDSRSLEDPTLTGDGRQEDLPKNSSVRVSGIRTSSWIVIICSALVGELVLLGCLWLLICLNERMKKKERPHGQGGGGEIGGEQVVQYDFASLKAATNYFSTDNKLGEGGFGVVYKGKFGDGQEVAIKRYSRNSSTQAINDFKVEAHLLGRLQHRNLVKLLGFCIEGEELLFVYEFMPNTSLDRFLFDPERRASMNWERRCKIIDGIARGLLYLHEDSRQKIIHRDLKASNILLDQEMSPKIADFGIAKPVETRQTHGDASRVVGTWGYMAPEYVTSGQFSVKSDVFSFGVIVLEIISGLKSFCSAGESHYQFLYLHAWKLWNEGNILDIIDPMLLRGNSSGCRESEVMRSIHVALLCVQQDPTSRPTMASIIRMLTSAAEALPSLSAVVTPDVTTTMSVRKYDLRSQAGNLEAQNNSNDMSHSTSEEQITELLPR